MSHDRKPRSTDQSPDESDPRDPAREADTVEEASQESFPASDPPAREPLHFGPPADTARDQDDETAG